MGDEREKISEQRTLLISGAFARLFCAEKSVPAPADRPTAPSPAVRPRSLINPAPAPPARPPVPFGAAAGLDSVRVGAEPIQSGSRSAKSVTRRFVVRKSGLVPVGLLP